MRGYELRLSGYGLSDSDDIDVQRAGGDFSGCRRHGFGRRQRPQVPGVDVELTRETIRYTLPGEPAAGLTTMVPTTEAILPATLANLAGPGRHGRQMETPSAPLLIAAKPDIQLAQDAVELGTETDAAAIAARFTRREPAE